MPCRTYCHRLPPLHQVSIVKPFASCACSPERFVVCMGLLETGGPAARHALAALAEVVRLEEEGRHGLWTTAVLYSRNSFRCRDHFACGGCGE